MEASKYVMRLGLAKVLARMDKSCVFLLGTKRNSYADLRLEGGGEKHSKHIDLTLLIHIYILLKVLKPGRKEISEITKLAKDLETGKCKIVSTELIVDLVRPPVAVSFPRILSINVFYRMYRGQSSFEGSLSSLHRSVTIIAILFPLFGTSVTITVVVFTGYEQGEA